MEDFYKLFASKGFVLYEEKNYYVVQKISLPHSDLKIEPVKFETHDQAINFIKLHIDKKNQTYQAIIRYRRGLGIEYLTVPNIIAEHEDEAKNLALEKSEFLKNPKVKVAEIKLRLQN